MATRWLGYIGIAAAVAGAGLFVASVRAVGATAVVEGVRRLGWGFLVICALAGARGLLRTAAWRLCLEDPAALPLGRAFSAYLAGDALGNLTPFGLLITEPSKILLVRTRVAATASIAALAVETLLYSATVAVMLAAGTAALSLVSPVPAAIARASLVLLAVVVLGVALGGWIVFARRRIGSRIARRIGARTDRIGAIEDHMFGFVERHSRRLPALIAFDVLFHAAAVFEIWFALRLITGSAPSLLNAFILEYVNRTITLAFQWVPMWLGVDEAGTGFIAATLGLSPAAGVSLALARKGRMLLWTAIGLLLWWPAARNKATVSGVRNAGGVECQPGSSSQAAQVSWDDRSRMRLRRKATTSSS